MKTEILFFEDLLAKDKSFNTNQKHLLKLATETFKAKQGISL